MTRFSLGALLGFAALALSAMVPAQAREDYEIAIALFINSGAVVEIGDGGSGVARLEGEKLAPPTPYVRAVVRELTSGKFDWAVGDQTATFSRDVTGVAADPVPPGEIHIAFRQIGDSDHRLLVISNGYDRALAFRAHIRVAGKDQYTDVCTVLPGLYGFEHWPYASDRILLTELRLEDWPEDKAPRCE